MIKSQIDPNNVIAWITRVNSDKLGRYEEAIEEYDRILAIDPNDNYMLCIIKA